LGKDNIYPFSSQLLSRRSAFLPGASSRGIRREVNDGDDLDPEVMIRRKRAAGEKEE